MGWTIQFPKYILIENTRLALFYYMVAAVTATGIVASFVRSQAYFEHVAPTGSVSFWADTTSSPANVVNDADDNEEFCNAQAKYDFCYDPGCGWHFRDIHCMDICHPSVSTDEECFSNSERSFKSDTTLFIPTYFNETIYWRGENENNLKGGQFFVKGVSGMSIGFQHQFAAKLPTGTISGNSFQEDVSSESRLLTVLKDFNGVEVNRWWPGEDVQITLDQILNISMVELDAINERVKCNYPENAATDDPECALLRITGTHLRIEMTYENQVAHGSGDWDGPICSLTVHRESFAWSSDPQVHVLDKAGSTRFRYYYGLRISFDVKGEFSWLSPNNFINLVTSLSVFVRFANTFVFFVAIHFLGHMSAIYGRFAKQNLKITDECESSAARLMCFSQIFQHLRDIPSGFSKKGVSNALKTIFKTQEDLDQKEIERFGAFIFNELQKNDEEDGDQDDHCITQQDYTMACTRSDVLDVKLLVGLFDADRKKSFLEKIFMDKKIRKIYDEDDALAASRSSGVSGLSHYISDSQKSIQKSLEGVVAVEQNVLKASRSFLKKLHHSKGTVCPEHEKGASAPHDQELLRISSDPKIMDKAEVDSAVQQAIDKALAPVMEMFKDIHKLKEDVQDLKSKQTANEACSSTTHASTLGTHASILMKLKEDVEKLQKQQIAEESGHQGSRGPQASLNTQSSSSVQQSIPQPVNTQASISVQQSIQQPLDVQSHEKGTHKSVVQKTSSSPSKSAANAVQSTPLRASSGVQATNGMEQERSKVGEPKQAIEAIEENFNDFSRLQTWLTSQDRKEITRLRTWLTSQRISWSLEMNLKQLQVLCNASVPKQSPAVGPSSTADLVQQYCSGNLVQSTFPQNQSAMLPTSHAGNETPGQLPGKILGKVTDQVGHRGESSDDADQRLAALWASEPVGEHAKNQQFVDLD